MDFNIKVVAEKLGEFTYTPLRDEYGTWFRLEFENPIIRGRKHGYTTAEVHLVDGVWEVTTLYYAGGWNVPNFLTPTAREWFTKHISEWVSQNANEPAFRIARQHAAKKERNLMIDQAKRDVEKTRLAHQEAMNKLIAVTSLENLGVDCPNCGCTIDQSDHSALFDLDPAPCPYCKEPLPEEILAKFFT